MAKKAKPEYLAACRNFLKEVGGQADVQHLSNGVMIKFDYRSDSTVSPKLNSVVTVRYKGSFIDGKVFDSSMDETCPSPFRLRDTIDGWQIGVPAMHVGDKATLYIPAEMGYGLTNYDNIPGGSALIFEIELIAVN